MRLRDGLSRLLPGSPWRPRNNFEHIIGVVVRETTIETSIATDSVMPNSRNSRPTIPPISTIGMNTATSETLIDTTVKAISRAPRIAACSGE